MGESTLALTYEDFMREVGLFLGWGRATIATPTGWATDATKLARANDFCQTGIHHVYFNEQGHEWGFFKLTTSIVAWATQTGVTNGAPIKDNGTSTVTAATTMFYPSMVGKYLVSGASSFLITAYVSGTVVKVSGDASGLGGGAALSVTADGDYRLPDNFNGIEGRLRFATGSNQVYTIPVGSEQQIQQLRQATEQTGRPFQAAVWPLTCDGATGQRFALLLYPTPEQNYTLWYRTNVLPERLSTANPYPLGGAAMAEVFLESCLAVAEEKSGDPRTTHRERFARLLAAAIAADQRRGPSTLGYNSNGADRDVEIERVSGIITYKGLYS